MYNLQNSPLKTILISFFTAAIAIIGTTAFFLGITNNSNAIGVGILLTLILLATQFILPILILISIYAIYPSDRKLIRYGSALITMVLLLLTLFVSWAEILFLVVLGLSLVLSGLMCLGIIRNSQKLFARIVSWSIFLPIIGGSVFYCYLLYILEQKYFIILP